MLSTDPLSPVCSNWVARLLIGVWPEHHCHLVEGLQAQGWASGVEHGKTQKNALQERMEYLLAAKLDGLFGLKAK
ncbi:hypothetical protein V5799_002815 [Amblyomma americanum]|uniref:Uncharacterized protein n=1 Tax=Amblyomma americanum TaxID=6943 RepID=A0AAQ4DAR1_AMBAM